MITLHQFKPSLGVPNLSPFCLKLETFLKMNKLEYQVHYTMNPRSAPKGKLPFIVYDGKRIADSEFIIDFLINTLNLSSSSQINDKNEALLYATESLINEHLIWCLIYSRWVDESVWPHSKKAFFKSLPFPLRQIIPQLLQSKVLRSLKGQGLMTHTQKEIYHIAAKDIRALSQILGDQPYFHGSNPGRIDASAFGCLAQMTLCQLELPLHSTVNQYPNLTSYVQRMNNQFFLSTSRC